MLSIDDEHFDLYEIQKSKFFSFVYPVFDVDKVSQILDKICKEYKDATHVCYAYVLDNPKVEKCSDDGEPSGTAGKPMLELIKKKKLSNVLLIVVRYFGGIKLGAGGLVRAYTTAGNMALDKASIKEFFEIKKYKVVCNISLGAKVLNVIQSLQGEVLSSVYGENVEIEFLCEGDISKVGNLYKDVICEEIGSELRCR